MPPDLVIEVDITSPSLNPMTIYAALGVPEVWRYDGAHVTIACLSDGTYSNAKESTALPKVSSGQLSQWMEDSQTLQRTVWLRHIRAWARKHKDTQRKTKRRKQAQI
jgi:Uma2 family endonuclease